MTIESLPGQIPSRKIQWISDLFTQSSPQRLDMIQRRDSRGIELRKSLLNLEWTSLTSQAPIMETLEGTSPLDVYKYFDSISSTVRDVDRECNIDSPTRIIFDTCRVSRAFPSYRGGPLSMLSLR